MTNAREKTTTSGIDPRFGEIPPELAALDGEDDVGGLPIISDVGKVLPIGYRDATGKVHRDFELVDWNWDVEEELGELAERNQDMPMGTYISEIVGRGLRTLGELDFTKLKRSQRRLVVSQLFHADALYVYVWIRIAALGPRIRFEKFECGSCRRPHEGFAGDLLTLEVRKRDDEGVPIEVVELDAPFRYGQVEVRRVRIGPLRWSFMETSDVSVLTNPAKFRLATLRYGVVGLEGIDNGAPVVLSREHAREMGPGSVNRLVAAIDEIGGGAVMQCVGECVGCGAKFRRTIDWTYDNFFGRSSR
jgi:hypothetical protein